MPTTPAKNLLYRAALPILAPHSRGQMTHHISGHPLTTLPNYERILAKHHVFGASLLLQDGANCALCDTSTAKPEHLAQENTRYRVASITKMATALVTLRCIDNGLFALDSEAASLLPDGEKAPALSGVTVRHLLCHTSGLRDLPILDDCLKEGRPYTELLRQPEIRACAPGQQLIYSNFGFGLLGCILEQQTGLCIEPLFQEMLFRPLHMRATLDASMLNEAEIMPITRVLPYRAGQELRVTALGRHPLQKPNPLCHYGHTAGAMYTDGRSVLQMLTLIHQRGTMDETRLIGESLMQEMTRRQSATPHLRAGAGHPQSPGDFAAPAAGASRICVWLRGRRVHRGRNGTRGRVPQRRRERGTNRAAGAGQPRCAAMGAETGDTIMDIITRITRQRGKMQIVISEQETIVVPLSLFRERPLTEGQPINLEEYDNWLMVRQYRHALDRAVACLAARAHSKHEIEQKLLRVGYRPCTVEMVLYKLEREHLLDDADFARQWVEARSGRKLGRSRIAQELRRKGIDADEAEEALSAIGEDAQLADAIALAEKAAARAKSDEDPRKTYQRIAAMLARRGFRWDITKEALAQVLQAD